MAVFDKMRPGFRQLANEFGLQIVQQLLNEEGSHYTVKAMRETLEVRHSRRQDELLAVEIFTKKSAKQVADALEYARASRGIDAPDTRRKLHF
jgi:hypothetical protein